MKVAHEWSRKVAQEILFETAENLMGNIFQTICRKKRNILVVFNFVFQSLE